MRNEVECLYLGMFKDSFLSGVCLVSICMHMETSRLHLVLSSCVIYLILFYKTSSPTAWSLPSRLGMLACSSRPVPTSPGLGIPVLTTMSAFSKCRLWDGTQVFMLARQILCLRADYPAPSLVSSSASTQALVLYIQEVLID